MLTTKHARKKGLNQQTKGLQLQEEKNTGRRVQNYCELIVRKSELAL
jgi:hypothetical protein